MGLGPVGGAFATWLRAAGLSVRAHELVATPAARQLASEGVPVAIAPELPSFHDIETILITVSDEALAPVAEALSRQPLPEGLVVLHSSGALSSSLLREALPTGVHVGGAHPVHPFAADELPGAPGIPLAVEGEAAGIARAEALATLLGMRSFQVDAQGKTLYHAGLALLSNGAVALFASAERLLDEAGVSAAEARTLLLELYGATGKNLSRQAAFEALTGPIKRGDEAVASAHLEAVAAALPDERAFVEAVQERQRTLCRAPGASGAPE